MNLNEELAAKDSLITAQSARIAELEAQIAAASWQKPEHVAYAENGVLHWMTGRKFQNCELYTAPQASDTDRLREAIFMAGIPTMAINGMNNFSSWEIECWARGALAMRVAVLELMNDTALQAPVREVPEGWISVSDRLPEPQTDVIVMSNWGVRTAVRHTPTWANGCFQDYATSNDEGMHDWDESKGAFKVTHWMPLPAAPVQQEGE